MLLKNIGVTNEHQTESLFHQRGLHNMGRTAAKNKEEIQESFHYRQYSRTNMNQMELQVVNTADKQGCADGAPVKMKNDLSL